ncbi:hypothetical protein BZL30_5829 [Mycobacterium kansasii]|uniref:Uncharacterized protein n=1 Tax=Mycobacterium kansasii TaxID=1768 RepID=A0A1V3WZR1_MYCKA|nr:hypothetical protein BZL30_5829 [Mycobacterium kansasii]
MSIMDSRLNPKITDPSASGSTQVPGSSGHGGASGATRGRSRCRPPWRGGSGVGPLGLGSAGRSRDEGQQSAHGAQYAARSAAARRGWLVVVIETGSRARRFTIWSSETGHIAPPGRHHGGLARAARSTAAAPPRARVAASPVVLARIVACAGGVVYAA